MRHSSVTGLRCEFIVGRPSCCVAVSFSLWNCSVLYMFNVNYSVFSLRGSFYLYACRGGV